MKIIKTGQPIFPIPLPRDLVLHKRIAGLPGAAGHRMWVAQNQELVLADAKRGVGAFLAEQKLPVHSTVCIVPTFFLKPHQLPGGYNVDAVSQFSDKGSRLELPKEIQIAASKDPALLRQMAVVQLVPGFSHFRVSTDQAGNAKKITPVFARPAAPGKIFVAREREQIHPPGFLPGLLLYRPGIVEGALNTMGFEEVEVPFLGVPLRIRQYIGQVVAVHRLLGEIFTGKFGKGFSDVFARGGGSGFYKWWLRGFGGGSFTLENLPLYAKSRWIGSELDTDSMNADAGSMAFYLAHMARLATEVMPDFVDTRMTIGSIPRRWQDVEAYLLREFPTQWDKLAAIEKEYELADAVEGFGVIRIAMQRGWSDSSFDLPDSCSGPLRRFFQEVLKRDPRHIEQMTPQALNMAVFHGLASEAFGLSHPFERFDQAFIEAGIPASTEGVPQTMIAEVLNAVEAESSYWNFKKHLMPNAFGRRPCDWIKLAIPYDKRLDESVLNEAIIDLSQRKEDLFTSEFILCDKKGASYWLYPDGMDKEQANKSRLLYRIDIVNDEIDGNCLIMVHSKEERLLALPVKDL